MRLARCTHKAPPYRPSPLADVASRSETNAPEGGGTTQRAIRTGTDEMRNHRIR